MTTTNPRQSAAKARILLRWAAAGASVPLLAFHTSCRTVGIPKEHRRTREDVLQYLGGTNRGTR
jgi:hypothetical protein